MSADRPPRDRGPASPAARAGAGLRASWLVRAATVLGAAALLGTAAPAAAPAQSPDRVPGLEEIELAADSGATDRARRWLERWLETRGEVADRRETARAQFLRGRLARDPERAEIAYLRVAVGRDGAYGPLARLRLAQLRLARGDASRALRDLEMLRADFPGHPLMPASWLWEGRARVALGQESRACRAFGRATRDGAGEAGDPQVRRMARAALAGECGTGRGATEETGERTPEEADGRSGAGRYAAQIGAFGSPESAGRLRDEARERGFEARVVEPGEAGGLYRVRVGRFENRAQAEALVRRLQAAGFSAIVAEGARPDA